ncbi:DUF21-domain-containing protein [Lentinula aciculospora]|uniref:DUF21-domain-containing protein n=1 Tax=Lentinula aciculospora TaxID=153920 RepID=A0A9W8ZVW0_9AGAR|nr:DUF21-domain-containing protein [Lentinula aciculospora]
MPPTPGFGRYGLQSSRTVYTFFALISAGLSHLRGLNNGEDEVAHRLARRSQAEDVVFPILIPILVLLSGLFAGLTLGYMSLDQTQLNVLSVSGSPDQRKYANKIKPIRSNGHLLLVTLLLANMIVNETLPIIADPVLGGGVQSVVVSTVLIVIFSEIIPQSLFTRYGLYLGALFAKPTRCLIYGLGIVSWPTAKLLDWIVGSNHGIIYRRVELKELIMMHSSSSPHGGDLNHDTAAIIGATLDLQEKVVAQAMTPLSDVFMVHIDDKLDYTLLKQIVETGHSRIPVFEEVEVPVAAKLGWANFQQSKREKKIIGILLVKQCVLLDPKDATPVRQLPLNKVPFIPQNETLLGILDKFQEGRSHIAIVSRFSVEKAKSVKNAVKQTLTQRLKERVGIDSDTSDSSSESSESEEEGSSTKSKRRSFRRRFKRGSKHDKDGSDKDATLKGDSLSEPPKAERIEMQKLDSAPGAFGISKLEANMPADAVLTEHGAAEFLQSFDPAIMPLGIITLEDVLEELIGEEIYDEFDSEGAHGEPLPVQNNIVSPAPVAATTSSTMLAPLSNVRNLNFFRPRSAPPIRRVPRGPTGTSDTPTEKDTPEGTLDVSKTNVLDVNGAHKVKTEGIIMPPAAEAAPPAAIEARLLDRKRRKISSTQAGAEVVATGIGPSRSRQGPKGKFKSGPLQKSSVNASSQEPPPSDHDNIAVITEPASTTTLDDQTEETRIPIDQQEDDDEAS